MGKSESQMDIVEKSTKSVKRSWTPLEIGLAVLLALMTCAVVAMVVLYSTEKVCTTQGCITAAARIIQNMDSSAQPCEDFYRYACGGWLNRNIIPETSSRYSIFDILRDELEIILKGNRSTASRPKHCPNLRYERDSEPLLHLLDAVGDWPVATNDWHITRGKDAEWSLERILPRMNADYNKRILVDMFVWTDDMDSSRYTIYVDQALLGMPSRDFYFGGGNNKKVRDAYLQFMILIAKMIREDRNLTKNDIFVQEEMAKVLEFEIEIANATAPQEERHDITQMYNKMTLSQLQEKFDLNGFNWTQFIQGIMSSVDIEVYPEEEVVVYAPRYLQKLEYILPKYSKSTIQNYLIWRLVIERVSNLSSRFKDARANYRKALFGTTVEEAHWRECTSYINSNMESAVGALYVKETFVGDSKRMVKDLIDKIREVFIEALDELQWMDETSKEKAREKALAINEQIGYPDYVLEEGNPRLDQEYAHLDFNENTYFENVLDNLKANAQKNLKKLGGVIFALFLSVFPAGILQPPFFSKHQLQTLNFGGIGMVIGHEITHGFDDNGRNFDKDGNMLDWWSNFSATHFKDQSRCMIHQYGNYTWDLAGGQNVNTGITTLGENIADNGGVRQAYKAYLKWMEKEQEEMKLPGLDLTHDQLFFLNFAQVWCGSYRPEYASQSIKTDTHSPLKYRVMGSLQNFDAFAEAFQCKKGNLMHPTQKCRVW
uniref:Membrane metalloendopeptidase like 1 n=1 Tax=Callorhinchus milii TaxID=7868 RepID=A0A4W3GSS2_CALMI